MHCIKENGAICLTLYTALRKGGLFSVSLSTVIGEIGGDTDNDLDENYKQIHRKYTNNLPTAI